MSTMQKSVLILLSVIAGSIFLVLFGYLGSILLQQPQETVANSDPIPTSASPSLSQPSATPRPSVQPTSTLLPTPTNTRVVSPTPTTTATPVATVQSVMSSFEGDAETVTQGSRIVIAELNPKSEYVDIRNVGGQAQNITGWILRSEKGNQDCVLRGIIEPGQTLRIWAKQADVGRGGFNCGYEENIWNNYEADPAVLFDAQMLEIDRQ